ncbi:protein of unknown function [Taphrina deformans PYCC 5710]|uniref:Uncharacterized protein n=1 Tax=Taphrina deformans (strain PYCC 5710 / ATCC 11124 / CBS 356.35 / IMI 108563 / JCM 9778 / NBRC 8474) TaxID=1097556 RepID=R4XJR5_TAPDE|nr:protein of unknown function [Taphrina deformans PYCC 5710]|eukprot:CCG84673.1 protein of unknown function [Taphrina deformans PYCC 5710]
MKTTAILALLTAQCLTSIVAVPTSHEPVALDLDRNYSVAELNDLVRKQSAEGAGTSQTLETGHVKSAEPSVATLTDSAVQGKEISKDVIIKYEGKCRTAVQKISGTFIMNINYNGKKVSWKSLESTIGGFGPNTIGGGRGRPITSSVEFYRSNCWFVNGHMCSYHFFGTAMAEVTVLGSSPGIAIHAVQPSGGPKGGWMSENCVRLPPGKEWGSCPSPATAPESRCTLQGTSPIQAGPYF